MKLFDRYNRLNIAATVVTFIIGSCAFYVALSFVLRQEIDDELVTEQHEVLTYVKLHNSLPEIIPTNEEHTEYIPCSADELNRPALFHTVKRKEGDEEEDHREVQFAVLVGGKAYCVKVDKPLEQTETLLQTIIGVTIAMIAIILFISYLINRTMIRRLWKPFYKTIDAVKAYQLNDNSTLQLEQVNIDEFALLNKSLNELMTRMQYDFSALKNFTGQAAHEMQTPLAVIRSRLDMLVQNEAILENNAQHITDIERSVQRLSRLHQSLLLLTKVENRQFVLNEPVQLDVIVREKCAEYQDRMDSMHLKVRMELEPTSVLFHNHLADIVVGNLLSNAVRYNVEAGSIDISLRDKELTISNTSVVGILDTGKLFRRFYREDTTQDGTGLGLSIVKQVCELAGYVITYKYSNERHSFVIRFH